MKVHDQCELGTPLSSNSVRVLLLGSGELGKELCIEFQRLGVEVHACDSYPNAPAMQVAHGAHVFNMKDSGLLKALVQELKPSFIVPEVEAIATEALSQLEEEGFNVVPSAKAVSLTMDREGIRRFASEKLDVPTARYLFATNSEEFQHAAKQLGFPCVVKPLMSSSGKGQCVVRSASELESAWNISQTAGRTGAGKVIVEEFVPFESEITLLTLVTRHGTLFCDPIGHKQIEGDYVESWQPHPLNTQQLAAAQEISKRVTSALGGCGIFGVEFFLLKDGTVLFSELSPRPHDTGMVTMATQKLSQFALHARAILGLPVTEIIRGQIGASAALRAKVSVENPRYIGISRALENPNIDLRIFGKPKAYAKRRMGVVLSTGQSLEDARQQAQTALSCIEII
jgi:phosphoribosylglycinamide formyltransferase 2